MPLLQLLDGIKPTTPLPLREGAKFTPVFIYRRAPIPRFPSLPRARLDPRLLSHLKKRTNLFLSSAPGERQANASLQLEEAETMPHS